MNTTRCVAVDLWRALTGLLGHHRARQSVAAQLATRTGLDGQAALAAAHHALLVDDSPWTWPVLLVLVDVRAAAILEYVTHLDATLTALRTATQQVTDA